ncbi:exopolyphosphatase [Virgisporangium aliadipatigenens]|uniref:Exopolyphosphatase n=1 Tax=Virgisporangium aliadipatigenens TaxID=741659 RepID=A0A8J3YX20_9ACTN|nr:acyclic terpene utilization AtuA family protein [Virgisporangium aliadipatigenens]GIJ52188.1 exopolyphosphatase [Virgisporangium aliadipatigenens]
MAETPLRIGNASGFYGDRFSAWREMLDGGALDVLTGDYLAELTMLILGRDRTKDPALGYAKTFLRQVEGVLGSALDRGVRIVTNAGGVNPAGLADALGQLSQKLGLAPRIAYVTGDEVGLPAGALTANAYLGAFGIAECLRAGADIVVTGRVTDASLVVGPGIARFGWGRADLDALAGATVAGHLIECGAQVTGGNYPFFTELPDGGRRPGFPLVELSADGSCVVTKHPGTGGAVTVDTVTAQLLYEIDGASYVGPDVVTRLDTVRLTAVREDRVRVSGATGTPPPGTAKVAVTALGGWRNAMSFVLCGLDVEEKAALVREQVTAAVGADGLEFRLERTDRPDAASVETASALVHVHIRDKDPRRAGRAFSAAAVELALASYPGCTLTAPPGDGMPFGVYRAETVPQAAVAHVAVLPDGTRVPIPPPAVTAPLPASAVARDPAGPGGPTSHPATAGGREPPGAAAEPAVAEPHATAPDSGRLDGPEPHGADPGGSLSHGATPGGITTGPTTRAPLGTVLGARSGDKGPDATLGVWARDDTTHAWLRDYLTVERIRALIPETEDHPVERFELPNVRALGFVIRGLLGEGGVAASTRFDPQAKALGEFLRARMADIPDAVIACRGASASR